MKSLIEIEIKIKISVNTRNSAFLKEKKIIILLQSFLYMCIVIKDSYRFKIWSMYNIIQIMGLMILLIIFFKKDLFLWGSHWRNGSATYIS